MIKTPSFWYKQKTPAQIFWKIALSPLSALYSFFVKKRFDLYFPIPMEKPVICVGNLVAGGAGKTPVVLSLAEILKDKGYNPHLLIRGYGGIEQGPLQVSPGRDMARDVGDEALLLVEGAPTWVSANRALGAQEAMDSGANIVIMDDGFQRPDIYKDFSFVVIDGAVGLGNKQVMPAGPLREPVEFGIDRVDAILIIGEDKTGIKDYLSRYTQAPILFADLVANKKNPDVKGKKVIAFAGIGRPEKFKETLEAEGADVVMWKSFPDHYPYDDEDLKTLLSAAKEQDALLLTTAKDFVRIPMDLQKEVESFSVHLVWHTPEDIMPLIEQSLQKRRS